MAISVAHTPHEVQTSTQGVRWLVTAVRVITGMLWVQNVSWKTPRLPDYGGLRMWTQDAVDHPVLAPYSFLVQHVVLPGFPLFGALALAAEILLGAFLVVGLATRFWAVVGIAQTLVITLSALYVPGEWFWSYALMFVAHFAVLATAAGRFGGVDAVLRPRWAARGDRLGRFLLLAS
ncbi:TQO small subunit DoxD [Kutzneria sp. NPDC052558]|uniref:TQO small subunit DoxD n=1 Tax=Kutzneria sp. NPDC052558 TaxID=3364121 RepID=UPI0037C7FCB5